MNIIEALVAATDISSKLTESPDDVGRWIVSTASGAFEPVVLNYDQLETLDAIAHLAKHLEPHP